MECEVAMMEPGAVLQVPERRRQGKQWWRVLWRCILLLWRATPLLLSAPFCWLLWNRGGEEWFWRRVVAALQAHGPIAVKFAQWASTRPDLLPHSVCDHFSTLQAAVEPHSLRETERILTEDLGPKWRLFLDVDPVPVGSGCMAQVYHGWLSRTGKQPQEVAIKVCHPGAQDKVELDLEVMRAAVRLLEAAWPNARYLAVSQAVEHFESFIRPQADLRIEAANLDKFNRNFASESLAVHFPQVQRPYVTESVLVESYEYATTLQQVLGKASKTGERAERNPELQEKVGKLCLDAFLKMLFKDNFIHADLHPGNIHVRVQKEGAPELVLLDAGLSVTLSPEDRRNFVEVFHALATNNGREAGRLMVERTPGDRSLVRDEEAFIEGVSKLVSQVWDGGLMLGKVRLGQVFSDMLSLACDHRVQLETGFVTVATSIIVIEGVGRQLNPITDLAAAARPLLAEAVARRIWK